MKTNLEELRKFIEKPFPAGSVVGMLRYCLGIDPGVTGAMALLRADRSVFIMDIPVYALDSKTKRKTAKGNVKQESHYDFDEILAILGVMAGILPETRVALEFPLVVGASIPGGFKKSPAAVAITAAKTSAGHWIWPMHLRHLGAQVLTPTPSSWKARLNLSSDKDRSIHEAKRFVPKSAPLLTAKAHNNRAEAVLLAYWGFINGI